MSKEQPYINFNSVLDQAISRQRKLSKNNKLLHLNKTQLLEYDAKGNIKATGKALKIARYHHRFLALYGINPSLLVHEVLHWFDPKTGKQFSSPMKCERVKLRIQKDLENKLEIDREEESFLNPILERYFKVHFDIHLSLETAKEQIQDACLRNSILFSEKPPDDEKSWWIEEKTYIGNFDYSSLYFEEDLIKIKAKKTEDWVVDQKESYPFNFVAPYDISQKEFCTSILNGDSSILQGPPGTGKSQTIVNLISSFAASGKKVLMVSSKKSAIEVVEKKLFDTGLEDLVFKSTQYNDSLYSVYKSVVKTVESWEGENTQPLEEHNFLEEEKTIRDYIKQMSDEVDELGMSIHQALDQNGENAHTIIDRYLPNYSLWKSEEKRVVFWNEKINSPCWISLSNVVSESDQTIDQWLQKVEVIQKNRTILDQLKAFNKTDNLTLEDLQKYNVLAQALSNIPLSTLSFILNNKTKRNQLSSGIRKIKALDVYNKEDELFFNKWQRFPSVEEVAYFEKQISQLKNAGKFSISKIRLKKSIQKFARRYKETSIDHQALLKHLNEWYKRREERHKIVSKIIESLQIDLSEKAMFIQASHFIEQLDQNIHFYDQLKSNSNIAEVLKNLQEQSSIVEQVKHALRYLFVNPFEILIGEVQEWADWCVHNRKVISEYKVDLLTMINSFTIAEKKALIRHWDENITTKIFHNNLSIAMEQRPIVKKFDNRWLRSRLASYSSDKKIAANKNAKNIISRFKNDVIETEKYILQKSAGLSEKRKQKKKLLKEERKFFLKETFKKRQHLGIKQLIEHAPNIFFQYKPIHLLSPQVVASSIPLIENLYDIVIFDESSQINLDEALSSIYRAKNFVVVGDPEQMPPSIWFEKEEDQIESLLDYTISRLPKQILKWHYRSKNPALIEFSNTYFYDNLLQVFPSSSNLEPFEYYNLNSCYESGVNQKEIEKVIDLIEDKRKRYSNKTIGVVALSLSQADAINKSLMKRGVEEVEVYNLENVQGDEMDIVILSLGYGSKEGEQLNKNFGPINQGGGPQRLNVLFTRAVEQICLISSFESVDLIDSTNEGLTILRKYLEYVEKNSKNANSSPIESSISVEVFQLEKDPISYISGLESMGIPYKIKA